MNVPTAAVEQASTNSLPVPPGKRLIDTPAVAAKYCVHKRSVPRLADAGFIPCGIKLSGCRRWDADEIDAHIAAGCPRVRPITKARVKS